MLHLLVNGEWSDPEVELIENDSVCCGFLVNVTRECNNPAPKYGGNYCVGNGFEELDICVPSVICQGNFLITSQAYCIHFTLLDVIKCRH